jgi:hypothetical protein
VKAMAKVKTEKYGYSVNGHWHYYMKVVKIDPGSGVMTIAMPTEVSVATGVDEVTGKTLEEVEKAFDTTMKDYNSCKFETAKVILYKFDYHSNEHEPPHVTHYNSGLMIDIKAGVYMESKGTAKSGKITWKYEIIESKLEYPIRLSEINSKSWEEAEGRLIWTQELEDFFYNTQTGMEKIIEKLIELSSPVKLIEFAYNYPLLTGPGGES